ncbi:hypothetical protein JB92DRAFT_2834905 [Gautieria morchelliformis]|nr:hypothetical protein JB92DRAFT_2834905 [Gautieria morchelliformis]
MSYSRFTNGNIDQVEVAPLETIGFSRLETKEASDTSNVLKVMEGYFGQSLETKMKDDRNSVLHGYKPVGVFSRVTENSKDCYETLKVSPIEMVEKSTNLPRVITSHRRCYRLVRPETARRQPS